jgi:hypothetical protein
VIAEAISCDDLPVEVLERELRPGPDPNPLFSLAMSLQPTSPDEAAGWQVTSMDAESGGSPWDLYLAFIDSVDGMIGRAQYNPDYFTTSAISDLLADLRKIMKAIVADPYRRVSSLRRVLRESQLLGAQQ